MVNSLYAARKDMLYNLIGKLFNLETNSKANTAFLFAFPSNPKESNTYFKLNRAGNILYCHSQLCEAM